MTSQQLQCFIYVAEQLNFTRAAEALYLSVPTVTHHIKSLEDELGVLLFYRNSRVVKLTEQGEIFYYNAKDILYRIQDSKDMLLKHKETDYVIFHVGCMTENEFGIFEQVFKKMKKKYAFVRPKVIIRNFFDLKNLYDHQQLELAIAAQDFSGQGYFKKTASHRSYALVPPGHPLEGKKSLSFSQIAEDTLITLSSGCLPFRKGNKFQEILTLHAQDHVHITSESSAESILLANSGYGTAIIPGFFLPADAEDKCILIEESDSIKYGFYYMSDKDYIRYFVNSYMEILKSSKR